MSTVIGAAATGRNSWPRHLAAVGVPLVLAGLAYTLWWISDRLLYVGPLDRAAFGWLVVMPLWIGAPVVSGSLWATLGQRATVAVAAAVWLAISAAASLLLWQAVAFPNCGTGTIRTPPEMALPSLVVGVAVGGGVAGSGLVSAVLVRQGRRLTAVVLGATAGVVAIGVVIAVAVVTVLGPACQRPSV